MSLVKKIPPWLIIPPITAFYKLWCSTLRITEAGREATENLSAEGKPMVFCLWHDEFFPLSHISGGFKLVAILSHSSDAEYMARLLEGLGVHSVRGSKLRRGMRALRQAIRMIRDEHYNVCTSVDGPKGPRHEV